MKKTQWLADPRLGKKCQLDHDVVLNARPGRTLKKLEPLTVGTSAHLRSGTVLYASSRIGNYFETGHHVVVREENTIGNHVSIWNNTTVDYGCRISHGVKIHCNCYIAQYSVLEEDVFLAPGVTFANDLFPSSGGAARVLQGPVIKRGAQIGVNVTVLPGVTIGAGALVGAGSVVTHDVPPGSVVWGNPAQVHKNRKELIWPDHYAPLRKDAARYYQNKLTGRLVFR